MTATDASAALAAIRAREQAATGGAWAVTHTPEWEADNVQHPAVIKVTAGLWRGDDDPMAVCLVSTDHEDDPVDVLADAEFIAHARTDVPRMAAALDAVLALHQPMRIYDECDHPHEEGAPGVVDTGEFLTCEEQYLYSICRACCVENPEWPEQAGWCCDKHDHREGGHCPTVAAITDALLRLANRHAPEETT